MWLLVWLRIRTDRPPGGGRRDGHPRRREGREGRYPPLGVWVSVVVVVVMMMVWWWCLYGGVICDVWWWCVICDVWCIGGSGSGVVVVFVWWCDV